MGALLPHMDAKMIEELHVSMLYGYLYSDFDSLSVAFYMAGRAFYSNHIIHSTMARTDTGSIKSAYWPITGENKMNTLCASQSSMGDLHFGVSNIFLNIMLPETIQNQRLICQMDQASCTAALVWSVSNSM